jgi:hypothetical protein
MKSNLKLAAALLYVIGFNGTANASDMYAYTNSIKVEFSGPEARALVSALAGTGIKLNIQGNLNVAQIAIAAPVGASPAPIKNCASVTWRLNDQGVGTTLNPSNACQGREAAEASAILSALGFMRLGGGGAGNTWSTVVKNVHCQTSDQTDDAPTCSLDVSVSMDISQQFFDGETT